MGLCVLLLVSISLGLTFTYEPRHEKTDLCKNKDADHLCGNVAADQHLCFRYTDSTIPLILKSEISSL